MLPENRGGGENAQVSGEGGDEATQAGKGRDGSAHQSQAPALCQAPGRTLADCRDGHSIAGGGSGGGGRSGLCSGATGVRGRRSSLCSGAAGVSRAEVASAGGGCRGEGGTGVASAQRLQGWGGRSGLCSGAAGGVQGGAQVQQSHKCRQRWVLAPEVEPAELEQRGEGWPRRGHRDIRDLTSCIQNSLLDPVGKDPPVSQVLRTYSDTGHKNRLAAS